MDLSELHERLDKEHTDALLTDYSGDYEVWLEERIAQLEIEVKATNAALEINDDLISGVESSLAEAREEIEKLKTYAMLLEGNSYSLSDMEIREALGLSQTMMEWLIPYEHRKILAAGKDETLNLPTNG